MEIRKLFLALFYGHVMIFASCFSMDSKSGSGPASTPEATKSPGANSAKSVNKNGDNSVNKVTTDTKSGGFYGNLADGFSRPTDEVGQKLLKEYGAMFVARNGAVPPKTVVFKNEAEVSAFQSGLQTSRATLGGFNIELQAAAIKGLNEAISDAGQNKLTITPRGADSARRSYNDTVTLWASRIEPGLKHWTEAGRLSASEASRIKALSPYEQVPEIFKLESQGMYFAKDLSKSIIYSVAPPGTSQHLSMLALDVKEFENPRVREILSKHGWYQTVVSDLPHFTYLGVPESELPGLGLKKITDGGRVFWVPDV